MEIGPYREIPGYRTMEIGICREGQGYKAKYMWPRRFDHRERTKEKGPWIFFKGDRACYLRERHFTLTATVADL